jgi:molybdopterin converting factor small subunit
MFEIHIPAIMRTHTAGQSTAVVAGDSVAEVLHSLVALHPKLGPILFDQQGSLNSFVSLFVDGRNIRDLAGPQTKLAPGQKLMIIQALAGG